jgi:acyl-coenzyme A thioesterase PaaI-like protein
MMRDQAIQDFYPEEFSHCYGCGRLNPEGMQIKSYWNGEESLCHFTPEARFKGGIPGFAYGGLISSLIDCHAAATACAAKLQAEGFSLKDRTPNRFVTASLKVDYLKPTPLEKVLELKGRAMEISNRKVVVAVTLSAAGELCAKGECIMVQMPEPKGKPGER